jgi:regulator of protease activity HflC (stomatin/prohibitin superfamily)
MNTPSEYRNRERPGSSSDGWGLLTLTVAVWLVVAALLTFAVLTRTPPLLIAFVAGTLPAIYLSTGFFTLQPNEAAVLILFGAYRGTVRTSGFHWVNPFVRRVKISLRARNLNGDKLKVNDRRGNPIEIAAVVVWRVHDTAQASFDVDSYEDYVRVQSESAVRHLASGYAYDDADTEVHELTLRAGGDAIALALREELQARFDKAGVVVEEARLTHLAYAPEIAQAMLRRQQAEAVVSARQKIVQGAVGMVEAALAELSARQVVVLDDERRAAMVSNLLVVLCGEAEVHPVVNTGTLYH